MDSIDLYFPSFPPSAPTKWTRDEHLLLHQERLCSWHDWYPVHELFFYPVQDRRRCTPRRSGICLEKRRLRPWSWRQNRSSWAPSCPALEVEHPWILLLLLCIHNCCTIHVLDRIRGVETLVPQQIMLSKSWPSCSIWSELQEIRVSPIRWVGTGSQDC